MDPPTLFELRRGKRTLGIAAPCRGAARRAKPGPSGLRRHAGCLTIESVSRDGGCLKLSLRAKQSRSASAESSALDWWHSRSEAASLLGFAGVHASRKQSIGAADSGSAVGK